MDLLQSEAHDYLFFYMYCFYLQVSLPLQHKFKHVLHYTI